MSEENGLPFPENWYREIKKKSTTNINPTGMFGVVELVTPELAREWLAKMPLESQRALREARVASYGHARKKNEWTLTHQGIAFDTDDLLRDGQHRLRMIDRTGLPTILFVVRNVPKEAFLHVDEQLPRTIRDAIRMAGSGEFASTVISAARVIHSYPRLEPSRAQLRKEIIINRLRAWADDIDYAESSCKGDHLTRAVRVLAARAHAAFIEEVDVGELLCARLDQWCQIMRTGMPINIGDKDAAAITYRNYLTTLKGANPALEVEKYRKGQAALTYFMNQRPMARIYGTEKDLFPVPKDRLEVDDA